MRTYRSEEMTDEQREEIAAAQQQYLRAWLAQGNHCIHCQAGQICDACRADHDEDPEAWIEFGDHPAGAANWKREEELILADLGTDAQGMADAIADPTIPF